MIIKATVGYFELLYCKYSSSNRTVIQLYTTALKSLVPELNWSCKKQLTINYLNKWEHWFMYWVCKVSCTLLYVPQEQQHWILLLLMLFTLEVQLFVMWLNKQTYKNEKRTMITNLVTALQNILSRSLLWDKRWLCWIPWNEMAFVSTVMSNRRIMYDFMDAQIKIMYHQLSNLMVM